MKVKVVREPWILEIQFQGFSKEIIQDIVRETNLGIQGIVKVKDSLIIST
jgi:hypothetical protein